VTTQANQLTAEDLDMTPEEMEAWAALSAGTDTTAAAPAPAPAPAADEVVDDAATAAPAAAPAEAPAPAPVDEAAAAAEAKSEEPSAQDLAAVAGSEDLPEIDPKGYVVDDTSKIADSVKGLKEQKNAIRAEQFDVDAKWLAGELTDEERRQKVGDINARVDGIDEQLQELVRQQTRAETLAEATRQQTEREQLTLLNKIAQLGKEAGLDYAQPEVGEQFDMALQMLLKKGDKTYAQAAQQAHRTVLALHGLLAPAAAAPTAAPAPAPAAQAPAAAPVSPPDRTPPASVQTLADAPRAGQQPVAQDFMSQFSTIDDPDAAEEMLSRMPLAQREAIDRSAYATRRG
jgi:2-oxoglutarate dehydrogenase E2 component (dihydrolipoamide succinyltransferase)